jgi:hypothetical protein
MASENEEPRPDSAENTVENIERESDRFMSKIFPRKPDPEPPTDDERDAAESLFPKE